MSGSFQVLGPRSLFDREAWNRFDEAASLTPEAANFEGVDMPETKTHGIIVPVPEISREERCALAFTLAYREDGSEDPSDYGPMKIHDARKALLAEASKAVTRAISSALYVYREAMREKYSPPTTVGAEVDAARAAEAEKEDAIARVDQAHKKPGIFRR